MPKMDYKKPVKNSTPKHLHKPKYKKATRKQIALMKELGIVFHSDISSFSAHALISARLGQ
jgi:hypothetical protein